MRIPTLTDTTSACDMSMAERIEYLVRRGFYPNKEAILNRGRATPSEASPGLQRLEELRVSTDHPSRSNNR